MTLLRHAAIAAVATVAISIGAPAADAKGACVTAGGQADMVTQDLAEFMAKAALKNSIAAHGWKPSGPIALKCGPGVPVNCVARQKACG